MRATILTYGTHGDVQPYVALALELSRRGHRVAVGAPGNFRGFIEDVGATFAPLAGDTRGMLDSPDARRLLASGDVKALMTSIRERIAPIRTALEDEARAACEGADLVIGTSVTSFLADTCAEAVGASYVPTELSPLTPASVAVTSVITLQETAALRARWRLPALTENPDARARQHAPAFVHAFSRHLIPRHPSWGSTHHVTGALTLPVDVARARPGAQHDPRFVDWLRSGPPPLYLGFGSLPVLDATTMMAMAREVAARANVRAVVGLGWMAADESGPARAGTVYGIDACHHDWLFPQCLAALHHGGSGTLHAAAAAGIPQIVCSVFSDQPFWGSLIVHLGLGAHVPFRQLTTASLADAVSAATSRECVTRAAELRTRLQEEHGTETAGDVIDRLARPATSPPSTV
ncbi:MAG: glycosyltransferase [Vicinamibacterales bacterium]